MSSNLETMTRGLRFRPRPMPSVEIDTMEVLLTKCPVANKAALKSMLIERNKQWMDDVRTTLENLGAEAARLGALGIGDLACSGDVARVGAERVFALVGPWGDDLVYACLKAGVRDTEAITDFVTRHVNRWATGQTRGVASIWSARFMGQLDDYVSRIPDRVRAMDLHHRKKEGTLLRRTLNQLEDRPWIVVASIAWIVVLPLASLIVAIMALVR